MKREESSRSGCNDSLDLPLNQEADFLMKLIQDDESKQDCSKSSSEISIEPLAFRSLSAELVSFLLQDAWMLEAEPEKPESLLITTETRIQEVEASQLINSSQKSETDEMAKYPLLLSRHNDMHKVAPEQKRRKIGEKNEFTQKNPIKEVHKTNKPSYPRNFVSTFQPNLKTLAIDGSLTRYLCTQQGSKSYQRNLSNMSEPEVLKLVEKLDFPILMQNIYGNYFSQCLFGCVPAKVHYMIVNRISSSFEEIALSPHGTHCLQSLVSQINCDDCFRSMLRLTENSFEKLVLVYS